MKRSRLKLVPKQQADDLSFPPPFDEQAKYLKLADDFLADIFPAESVGHRHALDRPRILSIDSHIRVEAFCPLCGSGQERHCGGTIQIVLIEVGIRIGSPSEQSPGILKAELDVVAVPEV